MSGLDPSTPAAGAPPPTCSHDGIACSGAAPPMTAATRCGARISQFFDDLAEREERRW